MSTPIEQNPPIRQEGNSIHIEYVEMKNISVDYEITVPVRYDHPHPQWLGRSGD